jgi:hypothetical protein
MEKNTGEVVMTLCLLGENEFQRLTDRGLLTKHYADYIEEFYCLQAQANRKGYKVVVLVFSEASFNEYIKRYGHEPVTGDEYAKARAGWAHWFVTSDPKRFGV